MGKTGGMGEHIAHSQLILVVILEAKTGQITTQGSIEIDLPFIGCLPGQHSGKGLGNRRNAKHGMLIHRVSLAGATHPQRLYINHLTILYDSHCRTRHMIGTEYTLHIPIELGKH